MRLGKEGKDAVLHAESVLGPEDAAKFSEAIHRYAIAVDREAVAEKAWVAAGKPLELVQTNGVVGIHPLWNAMLSASDKAAKRGNEARLTPMSTRGALGRPQGSTVRPDRAAPVTRLRRVT